MGLELSSEITAESALLYCSGQLTAGPHTSLLRDEMNQLLRKCRNIIVDLGAIDYIDSRRTECSSGNVFGRSRDRS